jgi:hypothetical protein
VAKLVEPAVYRLGAFFVACLRCKTSVGVQHNGSSLRLTYDAGQWHQSTCCCLHLGSPVSCCWFSDLRCVIDKLCVTH